MKSALPVRNVMTIGVPVCCDTETCGAVLARLGSQTPDVGEVVVAALGEGGMACGWTRLERLVAERDRGVPYLFLMHDWPGEKRPSAVISLVAAESILCQRKSSGAA